MTKSSRLLCSLWLLFFFSGCFTLPKAPERKDPYESISLKRAPAYPGMAIALLLTENSRNAIEYGYQGSRMGGFDFNQMLEQDIEMYRRNFKSVVKIDKLEDAAGAGVDLVIVLDRFAEGQVSVKLDDSLILVDPKGREIDKLRASFERAYDPASGRSPTEFIADVMAEARNRQETALRESEKLRAFSQSLAPAAPPVAAQGSPVIVAIFDVQDASKRLGQDVPVQLTNYLGTLLTQSGLFKVIPMDQIRSRLQDVKAGTFRQCYDESCQIELGKALSAQKSLATTLIQVGAKCAVTSNLFDLKTETTERGASTETGCSPDELLGAIKEIARQLSAQRS